MCNLRSLAVCAVFLLLVSCSSASNNSLDGDRFTQPLLPDSEKDALGYAELVERNGRIEKAQQTYRIGVMVKFLGNPFWQTMAEGMRQRAAELGVEIDIRAARTELDQQGQLETLQAMIQSETKPDILLISPLTSENLQPAILQAQELGIPVINVDGALISDARYWVGAPNYQKGEMAAHFLAKERPEGGKFAIIMGLKGIYDAEQRTLGFAQTLKQHYADRFVEVARQHADWDLQKALNEVNHILQEHPDLIGIYCNNDTMVLGATESVKAAGKQDQVIVIGTDGIEDAKLSISAGDLDATIDPEPQNVGSIAVEVAVRVLEQEDIPRVIYTPQHLITQAP